MPKWTWELKVKLLCQNFSFRYNKHDFSHFLNDIRLPELFLGHQVIVCVVSRVEQPENHYLKGYFIESKHMYTLSMYFLRFDRNLVHFYVSVETKEIKGAK